MIKIPYTNKDSALEISPAKNYEKLNLRLLSQVLYCASWNETQKAGRSKTRSQISGGGRKPWRQKGTGRARAGSIRSPLFRGGAVVFGPQPLKSVKKVTKKMKKTALGQALVEKIKNKEVRIIESITVSSNKTKDAKRSLPDTEMILLVVTKDEIKDTLPYRNIFNLRIESFENIRLPDLLSDRVFYFTSQSAKKLKNFLEKNENY